jgi:hypothetical protein
MHVRHLGAASRGCCHYYIDAAIHIEIACTQVHDVYPECMVPVITLHKSWAAVCGVMSQLVAANKKGKTWRS